MKGHIRKGSCQCQHEASHEFNAALAHENLSRKVNDLAAILHTYLHQAPLERATRNRNADSMARTLARIVGGVPTSEHPDCCLVGRRNPNRTFSWFCTGVLIHPQVAITAAHCNEGINMIALNCTDQNSLGAAELIGVRSSTSHPSYPLNGLHDLAVMILRTPATVTPTPLATTGEINAATQTKLVGFGNNDYESTRGFGVKREVTVDIMSIRRAATDNLDADEQRLGYESDVEYVAGGGGYDSCNGDSGGPSYIQVAGGYRVAGLTSRAVEGSNRPCGDGGIYSRVDANLAFIQEVARNRGITL